MSSLSGKRTKTWTSVKWTVGLVGRSKALFCFVLLFFFYSSSPLLAFIQRKTPVMELWYSWSSITLCKTLRNSYSTAQRNQRIVHSGSKNVVRIVFNFFFAPLLPLLCLEGDSNYAELCMQQTKGLTLWGKHIILIR